METESFTDIPGPRAAFVGGANIAIKTPPEVWELSVAFYRDTLGLTVLGEDADTVIFQFGPTRLHVDRVAGAVESAVWLELVTQDADEAALRLGQAGVERCDEVEPLPEGFRGFWIASPGGIVHLVAEPDC
jgi:catechol 2,3-dioxygenase-like lactoylglutathione lyase family enzyme